MSEIRDDDLLQQSSLGEVERSEADEYDEPNDDDDDEFADREAEGAAVRDGVDDPDGDDDDGDAPDDDRTRRIRELEQETADLHREIATRRNAISLRQDSPDPHLQAQMERLGAAIEEGGEPAGGLLSLIQHEQTLHMLQVKDMLDQQNLRTIMREQHLPARYENLVEIQLSQMRQLGMNPTREMVLQTLIGREVLERKDLETERQRQRGQRRIASQTVRPNGRGSTAASSDRRGRNQDAEDEAVLRSVTWGEVNR